jgi:bacterioferritin-associated ferredoxin
MAVRILCLCHDVTDEDVARAIAAGFTHPETVKRYTGALMGPCQGRTCGELVLAAIRRELGTADLPLPTSRPPAFPVRMGVVAGGPDVDG